MDPLVEADNNKNPFPHLLFRRTQTSPC